GRFRLQALRGTDALAALAAGDPAPGRRAEHRGSVARSGRPHPRERGVAAPCADRGGRDAGDGLGPGEPQRHLRRRQARPAAVADTVARSGILEGLVSVQSLHTTAAIIVNEGEPLLLEDLRAALERAAPGATAYLHDEMDLRPGVPADEPANGHAHCKALF